MTEPLPDRSQNDDPALDRGRDRRPRWVTAVILAAVLLAAVVVVLHLTGDGLGGPGSHLP